MCLTRELGSRQSKTVASYWHSNTDTDSDSHNFGQFNIFSLPHLDVFVNQEQTHNNEGGKIPTGRTQSRNNIAIPAE